MSLKIGRLKEGKNVVRVVFKKAHVGCRWWGQDWTKKECLGRRTPGKRLLQLSLSVANVVCIHVHFLFFFFISKEKISYPLVLPTLTCAP
jgi:hypothetical protein